MISSNTLSPCSVPDRRCQRGSAVDLVRWIWTWSLASSCSETTGNATITWPSWLRHWPISSLSSQWHRRPWGTPSPSSASKRRCCTWVLKNTDAPARTAFKGTSAGIGKPWRQFSSEKVLICFKNIHTHILSSLPLAVMLVIVKMFLCVILTQTKITKYYCCRSDAI